MKTGNQTMVSNPRTSKTADQENNIRKSFQTLQPSATDKKNLVGGGRILRSSLSPKKDPKKNEVPRKKAEKVEKGKAKNVQPKKKTEKSAVKKKATKVEKAKVDKTEKKKTAVKLESTLSRRPEDIQIEVDDLIAEKPSEDYWEVVAKTRGKALTDALKQNEDLLKECIELEKVQKIYKEMWKENNNLIEALQEQIGEDQEDTNNSVNDSQ